MRIKVYHDVNGTVRITKTIEQGSDMGKESSIFSDLKAGSVAKLKSMQKYSIEHILRKVQF